MGRYVSMCEEFIPTERVAVIVRRLTLGERMTTVEVAALAGITPAGARMMLGKISRVTPLCQDEGGRWVMYLDGAEI